MDTVERYPLSWPVGWKRTPYASRKRAAFSKKGWVGDGNTYRTSKPLEIGDGLDRLGSELRRLCASDVIISSNLRLNNDGSIKRGQSVPDDQGVAVYFKLKGKPRCFACDTWTRIADNLASIAGTIEALRTIDRYGVGNVEQAFAGYTAFLPAAPEEWSIVFGLPAHASTATVEARFKELAKTAHPDKGGNADEMSRLNTAYAAFKRERGLAA